MVRVNVADMGKAQIVVYGLPHQVASMSEIGDEE